MRDNGLRSHAKLAPSAVTAADYVPDARRAGEPRQGEILPPPARKRQRSGSSDVAGEQAPACSRRPADPWRWEGLARPGGQEAGPPPSESSPHPRFGTSAAGAPSRARPNPPPLPHALADASPPAFSLCGGLWTLGPGPLVERVGACLQEVDARFEAAGAGGDMQCRVAVRVLRVEPPAGGVGYEVREGLHRVALRCVVQGCFAVHILPG